MIADSIETPEFWTLDVLAPSSTAWPHFRGDDPGAASYPPIGIDYIDPDFILRFSLDPPDMVDFLLRIESAEARLTICNLSDRCSDEEPVSEPSTLVLFGAAVAALVIAGRKRRTRPADATRGP